MLPSSRIQHPIGERLDAIWHFLQRNPLRDPGQAQRCDVAHPLARELRLAAQAGLWQFPACAAQDQTVVADLEQVVFFSRRATKGRTGNFGIQNCRAR